MTKRVWNEEIIKIVENDEDYITKINATNGKWGVKQNDKYDKILEQTFGKFFTFSNNGFFRDVVSKIKECKSISNSLKIYAFKRALISRIAWQDETYIGTFENVTLCQRYADYWDFKYKGIKWDLKSSQAPYNFNGFKSLDEIISDTESFIRAMFSNASTGKRANPSFHKESNRFFIVFKSDKDKDYYKKDSSRMNTTILRSRFKVRKIVFDKIFKEFSDENIFHLKDVKYYWKNNGKKEEHIYKDVFSFVCLVRELENGELEINLLKNKK